jgi:hypothetical protein
MMIGIGSSFTRIAPSSSMSLNGFISWSGKFRKLHENLNHIPGLGDILILVDAVPLGG